MRGYILNIGIKTYVVSVGNDIGEDHLQDVANAGLGVTSGATYYVGSNKQGLVDAFNDIIIGERSCRFDLNGHVQEGYDYLGKVYFDGNLVNESASNGWKVVGGGNEIEFYGDACEQIKTNADIEVEVKFPCYSFKITPQ